MDNGESSCRRFLQGDKSAFDDILKEYRQSLTFSFTGMLKTMTRRRTLL